MITFLIGFLPFAKIAQMILDLAYNLIIKLFGLIFYLASEYWGRWVLAAIVVALALLYGRHHYIQQGREFEARFCELKVDDALRTRAKPRVLLPKQSISPWSIDSWLNLP